MQRWEEKQKQKAHELIVENAKSTLKRFSNSREKALGSSRTKLTPHKRTMMPINKILQIFQLEQYGWLLLAHGFPQKLAQKNSLEYLDEMLNEVDDADRQRFLSLLNTLTVMSKDLKKVVKTPKQSTRSRKSVYPPPSITNQNKQSPLSQQKSEKTTSKFRIKNKHSIHLQVPHHPYQARKVHRLSNQHSLPNKKKHRKSISHSKGAIHDDLSLVHDFRSNPSGQICPTYTNNRVMERLMERLEHTNDPIHPKNPSTQQIKLQMQKIKDMYLSYDSATLTSNITNIDLQQMIDCLALQTNHLICSAEVSNLVMNNQEKIRSLLHESFIMVKEESKESQTQNQEVKINQPNQQQIQGNKLVQEPFINTDRSSEEACSIEEIEVGKSSIWGASYIGSVINDFSCFDNQFKGQSFEGKPQLEDIRNFITLVMMSGKMEKQIPIIAFVYLKRLLKMAPNSKVTHQNWRNLLLITLIEASKIWDDQSLENHSFALVIKPFTTLEINRLEKYLLFFLDYHLNINQKQYSSSYFKLRQRVCETSHTANLMNLDLKTIRKLQGTNSKETKKKDFFKKCMNKSF